MPEKPRSLENPLLDSERTTLKGIKTRLNRIIGFVEKLEAAGINCDERRELCNTLSEMVSGLEREFPHRSSIATEGE